MKIKLLVTLFVCFGLFINPAYAEKICVGNAKVNKSGKKALVKKALSVAESCGKKKELLDTDTLGATGPQGPTGPQGVAGPQGAAGEGLTGLEMVEDSTTDGSLANNAFLAATATCSAGNFVVMGGCEDSLDTLNFLGTSVGGGVQSNGSTFVCNGRNESGGDLDVTVTAKALCIPFPS